MRSNVNHKTGPEGAAGGGMEKFSDVNAETEPTMIEDIIFTKFDEHDVTACHGLPEHCLDGIADQIIFTVTHGRRILDPIDYEMALRGLADRVRALPEREKAALRERFGMGVQG